MGQRSWWERCDSGIWRLVGLCEAVAWAANRLASSCVGEIQSVLRAEGLSQLSTMASMAFSAIRYGSDHAMVGVPRGKATMP
jgi:hypothetical protein